MGDEWITLPLSEAVLINPPVPLNKGSAYPFVDMQTVIPNEKKVRAAEIRIFDGGGSRFKVGDILMARITPSLEHGKISRFVADDPETLAHGSTEFIVIRGKLGVTDTDFAYYLVKWGYVRQYAISQMTGSSGRQRVPTESLQFIDVPIPPLPEQRAIAAVLGALDDKIELNRRMNRTLEAIAQAVFCHWFVENEAAKGWEVAPLPEIMEINPPRLLRKGEVAPYLDMANMPTQGHRGIEWVNRPYVSGTKFINGDTLLARITPCLENGKTAFVDFLENGQVGWGSTEYIVFRPKLPLPPEFGYYLARSEELRNHAIVNMTGTSGRQRTPASCFDNYMIPVPPVELAKKFGKFTKSIMAKIRANDKQSRTLAALRDALLPKLMRGEVRVRPLDG